RAGQHAGDAGRPVAARRHGRARLLTRRPPHRGHGPRAQPGVDQPHRERGRRHGRVRHAAGGDPDRRPRPRHGRGRRRRSRHAARGPGTCVRPLLHDQGGRQGHRSGARHLPPDRRRTPQRGDRDRVRARQDRASRAPPGNEDDAKPL
ncbi:MAG: hypothetical protein AVDCRST_MAG24-1108, partial [uncultured Nocardioidaceae bacterium]